MNTTANTTADFTRLDWTVSNPKEHADVAELLIQSGWELRFRLGRVRSGYGRSVWTKGRTAYVVTEGA